MKTTETKLEQILDKFRDRFTDYGGNVKDADDAVGYPLEWDRELLTELSKLIKEIIGEDTPEDATRRSMTFTEHDHRENLRDEQWAVAKSLGFEVK